MRYVAQDLRYLLGEVERRFIPRLQELFQLDADIFDQVIAARRHREAATDSRDKRRWADRSSDLLRQATEVVLDVSELSWH